MFLLKSFGIMYLTYEYAICGRRKVEHLTESVVFATEFKYHLTR